MITDSLQQRWGPAFDGKPPGCVCQQYGHTARILSASHQKKGFVIPWLLFILTLTLSLTPPPFAIDMAGLLAYNSPT